MVTFNIMLRSLLCAGKRDEVALMVKWHCCRDLFTIRSFWPPRKPPLDTFRTLQNEIDLSPLFHQKKSTVHSPEISQSYSYLFQGPSFWGPPFVRAFGGCNNPQLQAQSLLKDMREHGLSANKEPKLGKLRKCANME